MSYDIDATLAKLISPMTVEQFFAEYYDRKALVVRGTPGKFSEIYTEETWRQVPMTDTTAVFEDQLDGTAASKAIPIQPFQVRDLYEAGLLTVGRVDNLPQIAAVMDGLRASLQFPSGKNSFVDKVLCFGQDQSRAPFLLRLSGQDSRYSRAQ